MWQSTRFILRATAETLRAQLEASLTPSQIESAQAKTRSLEELVA